MVEETEISKSERSQLAETQSVQNGDLGHAYPLDDLDASAEHQEAAYRGTKRVAGTNRVEQMMIQ